MKKFALIVSIILVAGFVVSCGNNVEPVDESNSSNQTESQQTEKKDEKQREFKEADQQPLLWKSYEEFLKVEKQLSTSDSLQKYSTIKKLWKTIETERVSWGQNPFPELTGEAIDDVNSSYITNPEGIMTQFAINALLYRGAELEDIDALHMLKDKPQEFAQKFKEIYLK